MSLAVLLDATPFAIDRSRASVNELQAATGSVRPAGLRICGGSPGWGRDEVDAGAADELAEDASIGSGSRRRSRCHAIPGRSRPLVYY